MKQINETAFKQVEKNSESDRLEVIIGDDKQDSFYPQIKAQRWDNEANVSLRFVSQEEWQTEKQVNDNGVRKIRRQEEVKAKGSKKSVKHYPVKDEDIKGGGFEIEVVLEEPPSSNELRFSLEDKNVEYFYQPPLTEEAEQFPEADEVTATQAYKYVMNENGEQEKHVIAERPEKTVGSYAVYRKDKPVNFESGKDYRTGKVGHIYRPKIVDDNGDEVWGELSIENGYLVVTVPQDFLEQAAFPVNVDPTFGYQTAGASTVDIGLHRPSFTGGASVDTLRGRGYTVNENGDIGSINAYTSGDSSTELGLALYDLDSAGADSHGLVDSGSVSSAGTSAAWRSVSGSNNFQSGGLIPAAVADGETMAEGETYYIHYDNTTTGSIYTNTIDSDSTSFNLPDPWNQAESSSDREYSIYVEYTLPDTIGAVAATNASGVRTTVPTAVVETDE